MPHFDELAKTRVYTPDPAPTSGSTPTSDLRGRVALIESSQSGDLDESLVSWKQRLQMVCAVLLGGFSVFFVRVCVVEGIHGPMRWLWSFAFAVLAISAALLTCWRPLTRRGLLVVELLLFGGTACFFAGSMHFSVVTNADRDPPHANWLVFNAMSSMTWSCVLAFTYAMIAAESRSRATVMVVCLLAAPALMTSYERLRSLEFAEVVSGSMLSMIILTLLVCCGALIYWVYRFDRLRQEAARARAFGQYRLKQLIGRGGMGEVYLAEHVLLKRPCALKRIRPGHHTDPTTLARFEREVRATAELSHPHTVEIYDYGRAGDGTFYYVMEFLRGLTLEDLVKRHGPLPAARAVYLLRHVCEALEEAHAAGLIHRDIKPSNIYAALCGGEYDFAKLLDFGLVKGVSQRQQVAISRVETVVGSPLYMAPEQSLNERASDVRSDIYSLGAVGYFLVVGQPPFVADNPLEIMIAHARDPVKPPSQVVSDLPRDVEAILLKCLSKEPDARFATAAALGEALASSSVAGRWTRGDAARWWQAHADASNPPPASSETESIALAEAASSTPPRSVTG